MKRLFLKITPSVLLRYYNLFSNGLKYRKYFLRIGSNVSIINSNLGFNNVFDSDVSVNKLNSVGNLTLGTGTKIQNSSFGVNNNVGSSLQINNSVFSDNNILADKSYLTDCRLGSFIKVFGEAKVQEAEIGDFTYIGEKNFISNANIGKFCSIGPNLFAGWGIHPTDGVSTHPMFYSTRKQNGLSLSSIDKITERKTIKIGNDVFIGMNVLILDGIEIGDGAMIGAGAVVSKNIPPYAIAVGSPVRIIKYRYPPETIEKLLKIKWWNWELEKLQEVEKYFYDIEGFVSKHFN